MFNPLSTIRKVAASAAIVLTVAILPSLVGAVVGGKALQPQAAHADCAYNLAEQSNIYVWNNNYNTNVDYGAVKLWGGLCGGFVHTEVDSYVGSQNLVATVQYTYNCNGQPCANLNSAYAYNYPTTSWYGTKLNTPDYGQCGQTYYRAIGSIAGYKVTTAWSFNWRIC